MKSADISQAFLAATQVLTTIERLMATLPEYQSERAQAKAEGRDMTTVEFARNHAGVGDQIDESESRIDNVMGDDA